jgi:hypothetical protein
MSDCGATNYAAKFYISTTVQNSNLNLSQFQALAWEEVPNLGTFGDTGVTQNIVSYSTWGNNVVCKGKGEANAGDPDAEFLDVPSAGMDLLRAAASVNNQNNYAFKHEWADGSQEYNRGLVTGPTLMKGGNEDFKRVSFSFGLNQEPITAVAVSS